MEGLSSPGLLFVPILAGVVAAAVYSARLRRHGEDSTLAPLILRRECEPRNYGYALTGPACVLKLAPENDEVDAQHGTVFLKHLPHGLLDPAREVR
jgi:hypothetical protein